MMASRPGWGHPALTPWPWLGLLVLGACRDPLPSGPAAGGPRPPLAPVAASLVPAAPAPEVAPTLTPEQAPLTARAGEAFEVVLRGIPTTGHLWHLAPGHDATVVALVGQRTVEPPATEPPMVGRPTTEVFSFRGGLAGRTTLTFLQHRPWEGEGAAIETRRVEVTIR
ncbi:MAG: protease inhibitor I42 family protein [Candidatus Sericytochromatia bacterium]|nr:protease inhibitor I42 family protein [Candidatus Sericytochromatia bacterium]